MPDNSKSNDFNKVPDAIPESQKITEKRREAIQKLGKFSLYATPVLLGVVSKNSDAQVGPGYS